MKLTVRRASHIAVLASVIATLASASSITAAQPNQPAPIGDAAPEAASAPAEIPSGTPVAAEAATPAVLAAESAPETTAAPVAAPPVVRPPQASTLAGLVSAQPQPADLPRELNCLAGAIYFEAKSESLSGQLAVGRVVVARSKSGRFPNSYCGVVFQPSQFSFVRGGGMPGIARASRQWRNAVAVAQIAHAGSWRSPVEGALYFHATRVSPGWRLTRVARLENHVFYR